MTKPSTSLQRLTGLTATLLLAACATTPEEPLTSSPAPQPVGVVLPATAVEPAPVVTVTPEVEGSVAGITPERYADLFDRIRAGYQLEDVESTAVNRQYAFFSRNPDYLERVFGRASLYLHHIVTEIEARGMPMELALLPVVESAFEPYAYSVARASGLWQFIPPTGSRFGLKQNWWYDGRRDVLESTRAALDYLQFLHDEFDGDWLLAVAGYNCGENCVARAVNASRKAGGGADFWSISSRLPKETRAYVPKLLAMARLVAAPEDSGIEFSAIPNEPYFARVDTLGQIDMKLAADLAGLSYEELYELNPAFHRWATDPAGPHHLLVPRDTSEVFSASVKELTADERMRVTHHRVEAGDTVAGVSRKFNTQPHVVRELNGLSPTAKLAIGDDLRVPSGVTQLPPKVQLAALRVDRGGSGRTRPAVHVVRRGDTLSVIARRHRMNVRTLAALNNMQVNDTIRAGQRLVVNKSAGGVRTASAGTSSQVTHTIRKGDTLSAIAREYKVTVAQIASWNNMSSKSTLRPGQKLTIRTKHRG